MRIAYCKAGTFPFALLFLSFGSSSPVVAGSLSNSSFHFSFLILGELKNAMIEVIVVPLAPTFENVKNQTQSKTPDDEINLYFVSGAVAVCLTFPSSGANELFLCML